MSNSYMVSDLFTDTSHNDSLVSSHGNGVETSRETTPLHMLHGDHDIVRVGDDVGSMPPPRTRKVAAGPAAPSYRGMYINV